MFATFALNSILGGDLNPGLPEKIAINPKSVKMPPVRLELTTFRFKSEHSTNALWRHIMRGDNELKSNF